MRKSSRRSLRVLPISAALLLAAEVQGQGWVTLPNGELGFITTMTTTGFFQCGDPFYLIGSCQASGRSLTLGSGGAFMTLTFQGLTQTILATNVTQPVYYGTVTKSFSGTGPFLFPTSKHIAVPLFFFYIQVGLGGTTPAFWSHNGTWGAGYRAVSRTSIPKTCCDYLDDALGFYPTTPSPAPFEYGAVAFDGFWGMTMTVTEDPINVYSNMAIVPEPATLLLTATGLAGVVAVLRRRRNKDSGTT